MIKYPKKGMRVDYRAGYYQGGTGTLVSVVELMDWQGVDAWKKEYWLGLVQFNGWLPVLFDYGGYDICDRRDLTEF